MDDYLRDKLDENEKNLVHLFNQSTDGEVKALLQGIRLHNLAIEKELKLITPRTYDERYIDWQNTQYLYYSGDKKWATCQIMMHVTNQYATKIQNETYGTLIRDGVMTQFKKQPKEEE